jgi:phenazine biosynthesis protein phzE
MTSIFDALLVPDPPPFALLSREGRDEVELLTGELIDVDRLADIPLPAGGPEVLALVPFRQVGEVGAECHDDGTPLRCLLIRERTTVSIPDALALLPDVPLQASSDGFEVDDEAYAAIVKRVITDEIGRGEGANFVIRRDFRATLAGYRPATALTLFRRLLARETGAYWTFVVHTGAETLVGATPERHVSAVGGTVTMNPISGTYRYPPAGPSVDEALRFLADPKEVEELYMVTDEELKMMSAVCDHGGRVHGPYLKEMGHLAHTEYVLEGQSPLDVRDVLRETMFAATVTGSPMRNACRVIRRYEPTGRGYYAGVLALLGRDAAGAQTLDAPILIRTLYIGPDGDVRLPVGATLVRHSKPADEVAETYAKAGGVLAALGLAPAGEAGRTAGPRLAEDPRIQAALASRNAELAGFWVEPQDHTALREPALTGRRALVVDAEDGWTAMLAHLLRTLGLVVDRRPWTEVRHTDGYDLVVAGPGPGDPRELGVPKMAALRSVVTGAQDVLGRPLLAVCLGHQILCGVLGLPLIAKETPFQGTQREIDLFGRAERVGFYNTFAAQSPGEPPPGVDATVDAASREVHAVRGKGFAGIQFHTESILTTDGLEILRRLLRDLL